MSHDVSTTLLTDALLPEARSRLADLARQLGPGALTEQVDAPLDALAESYGDSASDEATSNLTDYLAGFVQRAYRVLPAARTLTIEQARDQAVVLLDAYDSAGGRGCDGVWADVQQHGLAALPLILGTMSTSLKRQVHADYQNWVADRSVHALAWPMQCELVTALLEACGAFLPSELGSLPPAQLAGTVFVSLLMDVVSEVGPTILMPRDRTGPSAAEDADAP